MHYCLVPLTLLSRSEPSASALSTFVFFLSLSTKALAKVDCLLSFVFSSLFAPFSDLYRNAHRYVIAHPRHILRSLPYIPDTLQSFRMDMEKDQETEPDNTLFNRSIMVIYWTTSWDIRLLSFNRVAFYDS